MVSSKFISNINMLSLKSAIIGTILGAILGNKKTPWKVSIHGVLTCFIWFCVPIIGVCQISEVNSFRILLNSLETYLKVRDSGLPFSIQIKQVLGSFLSTRFNSDI